MHKSLLAQDFERTGSAGFLHLERPRADQCLIETIPGEIN
jgi:hypothetical protein